LAAALHGVDLKVVATFSHRVVDDLVSPSGMVEISRLQAKHVLPKSPQGTRRSVLRQKSEGLRLRIWTPTTPEG